MRTNTSTAPALNIGANSGIGRELARMVGCGIERDGHDTRGSKRSRKRAKVTDLRPGSVRTAGMQGEGLFRVASASDAAQCALKTLSGGKAVLYVTPRWRITGCLLRTLPRHLYEKR